MGGSHDNVNLIFFDVAGGGFWGAVPDTKKGNKTHTPRRIENRSEIFWALCSRDQSFCEPDQRGGMGCRQSL